MSSLSALRYWDVSIPPPFGGARARPSLSGLRCWGHPSPLCGVGAIPSLSALRYRDVSIPPPFGGARARPSLSVLRCWVHPSPLCGAIPLHSAVSVRSHPSPLYSIRTFPSLHRSACARERPSLSGLRCWVHPSPLCGVGAIPTLSALRYRDDSIPPPFSSARARPSLSGLQCWVHPSSLRGAIHLHSAVSVRSHPSPLYGIGTFPSLHRSAVLRRDHHSPVCSAGSIPFHSAVSSISTLRCRCDPIPLRSTVSGRFHPSTVRRC